MQTHAPAGVGWSKYTTETSSFKQETETETQTKFCFHYLCIEVLRGGEGFENPKNGLSPIILSGQKFFVSYLVRSYEDNE